MASVKVGGSWRSMRLPYARISGDWKPVKQIYTKIDGAWKIAFDINLQDSFDSDGNLLETPGKVPWEQVSGTWTVSGGAVASNSTNTVAAVMTGTEDVELEIDTTSTSSGGPGVSFWIEDQSNWWGVRFYTQQYFYSAGGNAYYYSKYCWFATTYKYANSATNPGTYYCGTTSTDSKSVYSPPGYSCGVSPCPSCTNDFYNTFSSYNPCPSPFSASLPNGSFTGGSGQTCYCFCYTTTTYSSLGYTPGPTYYTCVNEGGLITYFYSNTQPASYSCPACTDGASYPACTTYYYSCSPNPYGTGPVAGYNPVTNPSAIYKRGQLIRSQAGSISTITSQDFGDVGSIYVRTYGNSVDFKQYSAAGKTGSSSPTSTYDAGSVNKGIRHGILVSSVPYTQAYNIGRFKATV